MRSSKACVFPAGSRAEPLSGCRAVSLFAPGAGGDQPELEAMMGRDVGIPVHPSGVPTQDPEWGQRWM